MEDEDDLLKKYFEGEQLTDKEKLLIIESTEPFNRKLCMEIIKGNPEECVLLIILALDATPQEIKAETAQKMFEMYENNISDCVLVFLTKLPFTKDVVSKAFRIFYSKRLDHDLLDKIYEKITFCQNIIFCLKGLQKVKLVKNKS